MPSPSPRLFIGLMSGTSLDGVDGVIASFAEGANGLPVHILATSYLPFNDHLRQALMALQSPGDNEIHREALAANALTRQYANCVQRLLEQAAITPDAVCAIGAHGQTIRHRPEAGYTRQVNNASLLAELTGIDVIADFRARDIAAHGQGAPLVPAFHHAMFAHSDEMRVVANIGGISNISILHKRNGDNANVTGFDTGPGNLLMDAWIAQHRHQDYDKNGNWAASGKVLPELLATLLDEAFFKAAPPKSTGRDLFNATWLANKLTAFSNAIPADVQATLAVLTATTLADAIAAHAPSCASVYICGGGAYNAHLLQRIETALKHLKQDAKVDTTEILGIAPNHVEAAAFAWLAQRLIDRQPGNLPAVTGAQGLRPLGALYPAASRQDK
jgi:anhydro-N-acetylmuramic acid kinase